MNKAISRFAVVAAFALAPSMFGAVTQTLTVRDGAGDSFTIAQDGTILSTAGTVQIVAGNISVDGHGKITVDSNLSGDVTLGGGIAGSFKISSASAFGLFDSTSPLLQDETSVDADNRSTNPAVLFISYTDTTYANLASFLDLTASENNVIPTSPTVTMTAFGGNGVVIPAPTQLGLPITLTGSNDSSSETVANPFTGPSASLTSLTKISFAVDGSINTGFSIATSAVPEPASALFLGTILVGVAGVLRKRTIARRS